MEVPQKVLVSSLVKESVAKKSQAFLVSLPGNLSTSEPFFFDAFARNSKLVSRALRVLGAYVRSRFFTPPQTLEMVL